MTNFKPKDTFIVNDITIMKKKDIVLLKPSLSSLNLP